MHIYRTSDDDMGEFVLGQFCLPLRKPSRPLRFRSPLETRSTRHERLKYYRPTKLHSMPALHSNARRASLPVSCARSIESTLPEANRAMRVLSVCRDAPF